MLTKIPDDLIIIIQSNPNLLRYLKSLLVAQPFTPSSWLYDGKHGNEKKTPDEILSAWLSRLEELQKHDEFQMRVYKFDTSQLAKWGPQGGHAPMSALLGDIVAPTFKLARANPRPAAFKTRAWHLAKLKFLQLLRKHKIYGLIPRSYSDVVNRMRSDSKLESNSGFPDFTRRNVPATKEKALNDATNGNWKNYPAIALFRTYNGKTRLVWMFPMAANVVEASFFLPLQDAILATPLAQSLFSPWTGFETVRKVVSNAYASGMQVAASDFTSTDAHFQLAASLEVYDVLKECFQPQYRELLRESIVHMHNIPLLIGPDKMLVGEHGVASGSNWTNFIETCFDIILGFYVEAATKGAVTVLYAIGDDMAWQCRSFKDGFRDELETYGTEVGQIIRADKTMIEADYVKSLQRLFQKGYFQESASELRAVYSTVRALKSSVFPEREIKAKKDARDHYLSDMFCARQFMILENCVDHPLFKDFVAFVCKGNHHLIPFAQNAPRRLDAIYREANLIPGLNTTYNQEKKDKPLSMFASVRYAATL